MTKSKRINATNHHWSNEKDRIIAEHYPHTPSKELVDLLGCSLSALYNRTYFLGIKKTPEFRLGPSSGCIKKCQRRGIQTEFKRGQKSWNSGLKGLCIGGEQSQFKPGHSPHNTLPIGSYRVTKDGVLQRKVSNESGSASKRWRTVHELLWVNENGPVPQGHICVFKPGMRTNVLEEITIENIECISFAENMKRNSLLRWGPEIAKTIQLRGAVTRQINRRNKANEQRK